MQAEDKSTGLRKVLTMPERAESFALALKYQMARVLKIALTLKCYSKGCPSQLTWSLMCTMVCSTGQIVAIRLVVTPSIALQLMTRSRRTRVQRFCSPI